jgi:hypothetical protein
MKKNPFRSLQIVLFFMLLSILWSSGNIYAFELSTRNRKEIKGYSKELGIKFQAKFVRDLLAEVNIDYNGRRVMVQAIDGDGANVIKIASVVLKTGEAAIATEADASHLEALMVQLSGTDIGKNKPGEMLLRTLNLLHSWPTGQAIVLTDAFGGFFVLNEYSASYSSCDWPPTMGVSPDICELTNQEHQGDYLSSGQYTGFDLFGMVPIYYPLQCTPFTETVGPYPYHLGECIGRCGVGCPIILGNVYTQDCFNHDMCVGDLGRTHPYCNQMFILCIDDFLFGTDCEPSQ